MKGPKFPVCASVQETSTLRGWTIRAVDAIGAASLHIRKGARMARFADAGIPEPGSRSPLQMTVVSPVGCPRRPA
jgi:hypothetical protein